MRRRLSAIVAATIVAYASSTHTNDEYVSDELSNYKFIPKEDNLSKKE